MWTQVGRNTRGARQNCIMRSFITYTLLPLESKRICNIIRIIKSTKMRWAGHVVRMGQKRNACRVLVGKPKRKRPLGRPRHRWEDNIKMDVRETGWGGMHWIHVAQDRDQWRALVNTVMNFRVQQNSGKFLSSWWTRGFSWRKQLHWVSWLVI
jgi:hypothetical protein